MLHVLAFQIPGIDQSFVILVIGLLIFGKRLPEVGRSLGKGIVEFKRGIKGIEDDVESASTVPMTPPAAAKPALPAQAAATPPFKFDPHTGQPIQPAVPAGSKFDPFTGKPIGGTAVVAPPVEAELVEPDAVAAQPLRGY